MSLNANQRRDQRRRLVLSWKRTANPGEAVPAESPRAMAAYDSAAIPENQRGPATLLPTGLGGLTLAILSILLPLVATLVVASSGQLFGREVFAGGGRFARTLAAAAAVFDSRGVASLQVWLAQTFLMAAASVALIVRLMRRHRRDDYKGRFRAWGWMAALLLLTACAGVAPLGRLVGAALADATGVACGPNGIGWWLAVSTTAFLAVSLWAVVPLHERLATAIWLGLALVAWGGAAAGTWLAAGHERAEVAGLAAWSLGAAFALIAMLAAARSVIREVRGQCGCPAKPKAERVKVEKPKPAVRPAEDDEADAAAFEPEAAADDSDTAYIDGSDHEQRHLSKAERKRLRKLARMTGAAA